MLDIACQAVPIDALTKNTMLTLPRLLKTDAFNFDMIYPAALSKFSRNDALNGRFKFRQYERRGG